MIQNKYKVPKSLWDKFRTEQARQVYNDVMEQSLKNQAVSTHPAADYMHEDYWRTICHNMACYAAFSVSGNKITKGVIVQDFKNKKVVKETEFA